MSRILCTFWVKAFQRWLLDVWLLNYIRFDLSVVGAVLRVWILRLEFGFCFRVYCVQEILMPSCGSQQQTNHESMLRGGSCANLPFCPEAERRRSHVQSCLYALWHLLPTGAAPVTRNYVDRLAACPFGLSHSIARWTVERVPQSGRVPIASCGSQQPTKSRVNSARRLTGFVVRIENSRSQGLCLVVLGSARRRFCKSHGSFGVSWFGSWF